MSLNSIYQNSKPKYFRHENSTTCMITFIGNDLSGIPLFKTIFYSLSVSSISDSQHRPRVVPPNTIFLDEALLRQTIKIPLSKSTSIQLVLTIQFLFASINTVHRVLLSTPIPIQVIVILSKTIMFIIKAVFCTTTRIIDGL